MRTRQRVTVTVPHDALAAAEADVAAGRSPSVSAWVAEAMETKARAEALRDVIDELAIESGGPLSEQELEWARQRLARSSSTPAR